MGSSYMPARRMLPWILNNSVLALSKRQVNLIHLDTMKAYKVKLKCTPLQALRLCTGRTAHRGSRGIDLLFHDNGTRRGEGSASRPGRFLPRERPCTHCSEESCWAPGPVWSGAENLFPTGIRSSDRPPRSQSLYRLSYPAYESELIKI